MKLLIDENLSPSLAIELDELFPGFLHVTSISRDSSAIGFSEFENDGKRSLLILK